MNEQEIVQASLLKIFVVNGYHDRDLMTQRNFDHISDEIEKKSGMVISGTTIKRLSKGAFNRSPQVATLNAIANYLDYSTWQEYKSSLHRDAQENVQARRPGDSPEATGTKTFSKKRIWPKWFMVFIVPVILFSYYGFLKKRPAENVEKALFSANKTTGNDLPNTVVFQYNIDEVTADSFFIQQSWDVNRRVRIHKNKYTITDIYYEPGYHIAKLIANDSVIKTIDVNIPTDKWVFYANENKTAYLTEYISTKKSIQNGSMAITKEDLLQNDIDPDKEKIFLYSYFPSKHEVNSDNFILETKVRMKKVRNSPCPYIAIEVYGQRYFLIMKSTAKGCANLASLFLGEKAFNGSEVNLAPITFDVTQWTDVALQVRDKNVTIKINDQEAFSTTYHKSLKFITGLSFISNGLCEIAHVSLKGLDGKIFLNDDFESK